MNSLCRKRLVYGLSVVFIILLGLGSRCLSFIPECVGDALWAMMVFCLFRFLCVRCKLWKIALASLLFSYLVEFSQLIQWPILCEARSTTIGHLILGQGFLWSDLVAYTVGILNSYYLFGGGAIAWVMGLVKR